MANIKITDLVALTDPATTDVLPVVDIANDETKKVAVGEIVGKISGDVDVATDGTSSIAAGVIVDADVNASAAIAGTKIDPDFGSQTIETTGVFSAAGGEEATPSITFTGDLNTGIYSPGADQVAISTNGTGRLFVDANGRFGFGASPEALLHISAATPNIRLSETDQAVDKKNWDIAGFSGSLNFRALSDDGSAANRYLEAARDAAYGITALKFFTGSDQERLRITSDGRVGVGTSNPGHPLHVSANENQLALFERPSATAKIYVKSPATTSLYLDGTDSVLAFVNKGGAIPSYIIGRDNTDNTLRISQGTLNPGTNDLITIKSTGQVGIGTTSPAVACDVVGQVRASTGILFGSDTAAANALDDYEEGTWTPAIEFGGASAGITYSLQIGTYTKIGRIVAITFEVRTSSKGSSTGVASVNGLPFNASSNSTLHLVTGGLTIDAKGSAAGIALGGVFLIRGEQSRDSSYDDTAFSNSITIAGAGIYYV